MSIYDHAQGNILGKWMQTYEKKGISIGPKELGETSAERNHKLRLTKGKKKGRRQNSREGEIFNRYKPRKYYQREKENNLTF